jgi:hypothetical protein
MYMLYQQQHCHQECAYTRQVAVLLFFAAKENEEK